MIVIYAEKPSVARDIAAQVKATQKKEGYLEGNGHQVTWGFGHLVEIASPEENNSAWGGKWHMGQLPMLPDPFKLTVKESARKQYKIVKTLFKDCDSIICATDAGREGELIFRWVYQLSGCKKPFQRLWISDLTDESIRKGLQNLKPGTDFNPLAAAAECRAFADWLVGMNATRGYSIHNNLTCPVGRVQTPTLALIVDRDAQIQSFTKAYYYELSVSLKETPFKWYALEEGKRVTKIEKKDLGQSLLEKVKVNQQR